MARSVRLLGMRMKSKAVYAVSVAVLLCALTPLVGFLLRESSLVIAGETRVLVALSAAPQAVKAVSAACAMLFSTLGCTAVMVVLAIVEYRRVRSVGVVARELVIALGPIVYITAVKWVVVRPRPVTSVGSAYLPGDPSFPSGHTAAAVAVATMLVLMLRHVADRRLLAAGAVALVLVVACSRLVLGVHFPSDVMTSMIVCPAISFALWTLLGAPQRG